MYNFIPYSWPWQIRKLFTNFFPFIMEIPYPSGVSIRTHRRLMREIRYHRFPKEEEVIQKFYIHRRDRPLWYPPALRGRCGSSIPSGVDMTPELSWILYRQPKPSTQGRYDVRYERCGLRYCEQCEYTLNKNSFY